MNNVIEKNIVGIAAASALLGLYLGEYIFTYNLPLVLDTVKPLLAIVLLRQLLKMQAAEDST